ncbi:histone H4 transcription factor-like [Phymastichus coffea]|uniref:histone H4 transcription factor-like n=1 Tax=Phymastichus coffea TaxID=108790 RepID=UPI00273AC87B|nr:histone H4 transcription factor-like [Phymastichus coffea]
MVEPFVTSSKDAQERCSHWVKNVKEAYNFNELNIKRKTETESEECIETDSEFDSVSECGTKRRKVGVKLKAEKLDLICEWKACNFTCKFVDLFIKHVANHITELAVEEISGSESYVCLWSGCDYNSGVSIDIMRHVNYHAFHSKLKSIGVNVRNRMKLPKCQRDKDWKNILESLPEHDCSWEGCETDSFSNYQMFLYHILTHVENNPRGNKVKGGIDCQWSGCKGNYVSLYKLREHLRVHTKEKIIACPDCGSMFASNTKFHDHCKRQISLEVQGFQCSHCHKFYPTESLLREHMRNHIFHYKCNMCDMSCDSPSGLAKHILYRHTSTRNFPCKLCSHAAKSQKDLDSHMTLHFDRSNYTCNIEGCLYSCKNAYTLDRHVEKIHRLQTRWYCCHECPIKYKKSYPLTKHLMEAHHLQWLKGHKRFQYVLEDDGCYRLQTIRYESTDENVSTSSQGVDQDPLSTVNYKVAGEFSYEKPAKSLPTIQNILISIDEIDEHGNVIESQIIETQETNVLPPSVEPPIILT